MAHTKASGTTKNVRDSQPKFLGVKLYDGQIANPGSIIIRQRGTKFVAGLGTRRGSDDTIYAVKPGRVKFITKRKVKYDGNRRTAKIVSVS